MRNMSAAAEDLDRARQGDDDAFARLVAPLRGELHAHCYRLLGSTHDADDAVQNALLRAWRSLSAFEGRSSMRAWLYRVATNTSLDLAAARGRRALPMDLGPASADPVPDDRARDDVAWLSPYPDGPEKSIERRESIELAFVAALQHLPGNQRAALVLFEVLGFSAAEIAAMLDTTPAAVNSALQRARSIMAERRPDRPAAPDAAQQRGLAHRFARALDSGDADAVVALLGADVTWSMPPLASWYAGVAAVSAFVRTVPLGACGRWRHRIVAANGTPAVALYLQAAPGEPFRAWSINVLATDGEHIEAVTSFIGPEHFVAFGLPPLA